MSRPPTPQEIRATNPNMTQRCDKCDLVQQASEHFGTFDNMLTLTASGGYGEYVDNYGISKEKREFHLCHKCAHKLMTQFFSQWDLSGWHSGTKDRYCDGWTMKNWYDSQMTRLNGYEDES